jgi:hypothetical protein
VTGSYPAQPMPEAILLLERWHRAYARLAVVSEAPAAAALDNRVQIAHVKGREGSPPSRPPGDEPLADRHRRKLREWYLLFAGPSPYGDTDHPGVSELRKLCSEIERDTDRMTHRAPARKLESETERDARCLSDYEGVHYEDAAVKEGCSPGWMRKLRSRAGRRPLDGLIADKNTSQSGRTLPVTSSECATSGTPKDAAGSGSATTPDDGGSRH